MTSISELNCAHQGSAFMLGSYVSYIYIREWFSIQVTRLLIISRIELTYCEVTSGDQNDFQQANWTEKILMNFVATVCQTCV